MRLDTVNSGRVGSAQDQLRSSKLFDHRLPTREPIFDAAESNRRIRLVQTEIGRRDLAATLVLDAASIFYLTGVESASVSHLQCLVVPATGPMCLFTWDFELGNVALPSPGLHVATYNWYEDPKARLAETLRELRLDGDRLGIDLRSAGSVGTLATLKTELPSARFEDGFGIVEECRMRKAPAELAYMREAALITDRSVEVGFDHARVGAKDSEVAAAIMQYLFHSGSGVLCSGPIVATGYNAGVGHASFTGRSLEPGDTVFLEYSAEVHHYVAPVMRTAVLGRPTPEQTMFRDAGLAAIDAVLSTARPGVPASVVASAALDCLKPIRDKIYFHGLVAYSVGLGFPPSRYEHLGFELKESNDRLLEEGMAFHVVMSLRKFAEFGISQSHTVVVTPTGCEALTQSPAALRELPV